MKTIKRYRQHKEYYFTEGCFINELWNTIEDENVSIARARLVSGETTKWHQLEGIAERYVILEGKGVVEVGNNAPSDVKPGDVVMIPAGTRQRIRSTGQDDLVFLAICTPRFVARAYRD